MRFRLPRFSLEHKDPVVKLTRVATSNEGTEGVMHWRRFTWDTIELPWRDNQRNKSCIPDGEYQAIWNRSPRFGRLMYLLLDVPGRGGIRIHSGNWAGDSDMGYETDSLGCPLLGMAYGEMQPEGKSFRQSCVFRSAIAVRQFERLMRHRPFVLQVS